MDINQASLQMHYDLHGKIEVISRKKIETREDLSLAYTPGVAEPCRVIAKDYEQSFKLTRRSNLVAVITDGTAVLGLGDIGPAAGMPVMEGKCALFKEFADVDAFPLCIDSKDTDTIVQTIYLISKSFGGINLEDIAAPRCFEIERRLKEMCDIKRTPCRVEIILKESEFKMRYELFKRLNTGGEGLSRQEIRNCIFRGLDSRYSEFIAELAQNDILEK